VRPVGNPVTGPRQDAGWIPVSECPVRLLPRAAGAGGVVRRLKGGVHAAAYRDRHRVSGAASAEPCRRDRAVRLRGASVPHGWQRARAALVEAARNGRGDRRDRDHGAHPQRVGGAGGVVPPSRRPRRPSPARAVGGLPGVLQQAHQERSSGLEAARSAPAAPSRRPARRTGPWAGPPDAASDEVAPEPR